MKKINVGIIGSGFIVPVFLNTAGMFEEFHIRGLWGRHEEKIRAFANDADYCTTDLDRLLNDKEIDVIYVALPNKLHYEYAMIALKHGKNVILEKPFTVRYVQAKRLFAYAEEHDLILYEAITTIHSPNYLKAKEYVKQLGEIRMVECNFSQYSRRYARFKEGIIAPAFDKNMAGGALMDLNVYNIHFVTGIFGRPKKAAYFPNVERDVDTSGVLVLDYGTFKASLIAGKDCRADCYGIIQGDEGYLRCNTTCSRCAGFTLKKNDGSTEEIVDEDSEFTGWKHEMREFIRLYREHDTAKLKEYSDQTLNAVWVLEKAVKSAGLGY